MLLLARMMGKLLVQRDPPAQTGKHVVHRSSQVLDYPTRRFAFDCNPEGDRTSPYLAKNR